MSTTYIILIIILAALIVTFLYALLSSGFSTTNINISKNINVEPIIGKSLNMFGGDIYSLLPQSVKNKYRHNSKIERIFIAADNPWKVTPIEFLLLRFILGAIAGVTSIIAILVSQAFVPLFISIPVGIGLTFFAYYYPMYFYNSTAEDRLNAFKTDLPDAIDYLIIALASGSIPLSAAIGKILAYLPEDSTMYEEFKRIDEDIHSGRTMNDALNSFAERAPSPEITAFVNALNSANRLNTPIVSLLRERAKAARKDRDHEIDKQITRLPTKVMLAFGPASYISILIVALAPALVQLMQVM